MAIEIGLSNSSAKFFNQAFSHFTLRKVRKDYIPSGADWPQYR